MGVDEASEQESREAYDPALERENHGKRLETKGRLMKESLDVNVSRFEVMMDRHLHENANVTWTASSCIEISKVIYPCHPERSTGDGGDGGGEGDVRRIGDVGLRVRPGKQQ